MPEEFTTAEQAWVMVKNGNLSTLKTLPISQHFTWGEVFVWRKDERLQKYLTFEILFNSVILAQRLTNLRNLLGKPITVSSWYRDPISNKEAGGALRSKHMSGLAADIQVTGLSPAKVQALLKDSWPGGLGYGQSFTHLDLGPKRRFHY